MVDRQAADRSQGRRRGGGDDQGRGPVVVAGDHHGQGQGVNNVEVAVPQPAGVAGRGVVAEAGDLLSRLDPEVDLLLM